MIINYIYRILWFVGLVLLQVLILNNIHLAGYATPFLYTYFILKFPSSVSRNELLLWAFFLGLIIDIFSNTPGINASATVLMAFVRPPLLTLFTPRDSFDNIVPSFKTIGNFSFIKYLLICLLIHHGALLTIEFFSFADIGTLILRIASSTLLTLSCILAFEGVKK